MSPLCSASGVSGTPVTKNTRLSKETEGKQAHRNEVLPDVSPPCNASGMSRTPAAAITSVTIEVDWADAANGDSEGSDSAVPFRTAFTLAANLSCLSKYNGFSIESHQMSAGRIRKVAYMSFFFCTSLIKAGITKHHPRGVLLPSWGSEVHLHSSAWFLFLIRLMVTVPMDTGGILATSPTQHLYCHSFLMTHGHIHKWILAAGCLILMVRSHSPSQLLRLLYNSCAEYLTTYCQTD